MSFYAMHIDKIRPSDSGTHYDKIKNEFKAIVQELGDSYGRNATKFADIWVSRLLKADYTTGELRAALDHCVESVTYMPSFADFKNLAAAKRGYQEAGSKADAEHKKKYAAEIAKVAEVRASMQELGYGEKEAKYVTWWFEQAYGKEFLAELQAYGLELKSFAHCALLDLHDAGYKFDKVPAVIQKKATNLNT